MKNTKKEKLLSIFRISIDIIRGLGPEHLFLGLQPIADIDIGIGAIGSHRAVPGPHQRVHTHAAVAHRGALEGADLVELHCGAEVLDLVVALLALDD